MQLCHAVEVTSGKKNVFFLGYVSIESKHYDKDVVKIPDFAYDIKQRALNIALNWLEEHEYTCRSYAETKKGYIIFVDEFRQLSRRGQE